MIHQGFYTPAAAPGRDVGKVRGCDQVLEPAAAEEERWQVRPARLAPPARGGRPLVLSQERRPGASGRGREPAPEAPAREQFAAEIEIPEEDAGADEARSTEPVAKPVARLRPGPRIGTAAAPLRRRRSRASSRDSRASRSRLATSGAEGQQPAPGLDEGSAHHRRGGTVQAVSVDGTPRTTARCTRA